MLINYNGESKVIKRICELLNTMSNVNFEVVAELPTVDISTSTIYLVPKSTAGQDNIYDEYINTDGTSAGWELIGDTDVDLSNYYNKTETDNLLSAKAGYIEVDSGDLDDFKTTGFYLGKSGNTCTNKPSGILQFGLLVVQTGSTGYYRQILWNPNGSVTYTRIFGGGTWRTWTQIVDMTYDDKTKLDNSVDWESHGILGAKNLLPYPYAQTTQTVNGVTVTDLGDGSLDFNNTSTSAGVKIILVANDVTKAIPLKKAKYKFTWGNTTAPRMDFTLIKQDNTTETITGSDGYIDLDNTDGTYKGVYYIRLRTSATASFDHKIVYPMMRYATDSDETWQPYAMTNKELSDKKADKWQDLGNWNTTSVGSSMSYSDKYDEFLIRIVGTTYSLDVHILNIAGVITGASGRIYRNYYQSDSQNYMAVNVGLTFGIDTIILALETGTEEVINGSSQSIQQIRTFAR